ncbi:Oligoribonuclease, mitochondrial [Tyrophagus putrescentiae]|nr:Oligoribonuclease, mitochondrial [Tyrophagus putrescentiae]
MFCLKRSLLAYVSPAFTFHTRNLSKRKMTDKLVWVDCEMTGLDVNKDRLLELDSIDSLYIGTSKQVLDAMPEWHQEHFTANGLIEKCLNSKLTLEQVDTKLSDFMVKNNIKTGILAGNSIAFDREFLKKNCPKFMTHLHYRMVDVSAVKVLVSSWYKDTTYFNKQTEHRALSDIKQSIDELKYYRENYFKKK